MPLYVIEGDAMQEVPTSTFSALKLREREGLQAMLLKNPAPLGEDLMVLCEEFGNWQDSRRRIDLLGLSRDRRLVVVEIKRTEDGGHMELQAIRYAAMVSGMTLRDAVAAHAMSLTGDDRLARAEAAVLEHLNVEAMDEVALTGDVRIMLVSADFSTEITSTVLWLINKHRMDIRCIRLRPYVLGEKVMIDVDPIIPLPEAEDYLVKLREQQDEEDRAESNRQLENRQWWEQFIAKANCTTELFRGRGSSADAWLGTGIGKAGVHLVCALQEKNRLRVEIYINFGKAQKDRNQALFNALHAQQETIEQELGHGLVWEPLVHRVACRISLNGEGGRKSPKTEWPKMQDWLIQTAVRFDQVFRKRIAEIQV